MPKSFPTIADPKDAAAYADAFAGFVSASPTSFHAVETVAGILADHGFVLVDERDEWPAGPGRFVVRRDGSILAWVVPEGATALTPWRILGAHTDSPSLRLKGRDSAFGSHGWRQDAVEVYGGPILASWFDRDLEFAGRLTLRDGSAVLVRSGPIARVPHLAPHLDRSINDAFSPERQLHLQPVWGVGSSEGAEEGIVGLLAERAGIAYPEVAGADIFAVDSQAPGRLGADRELFASPRLDNLISVFASVNALIAEAEAPDRSDYVTAMAAFDHEEVGSGSRSGAQGSLLEDTWRRVSDLLGATSTEMLRSRASSWLISMDVGHVVHPNYSSKHDPRIQPVAGGGPLLKVNANLHYASDGRGEALWSAACQRAGVPMQLFVSNNDVPCGTTIGPLVATRLGISTVDVGAGILSMHSARELVHIDDLAGLARATAAALAC